MDVRDLVWNEDGDVTTHQLYTSDVKFEDIPRVIREHRDLRRALHKCLDLLKNQGYDPGDEPAKHELDRLNKLRSQLII